MIIAVIGYLPAEDKKYCLDMILADSVEQANELIQETHVPRQEFSTFTNIEAIAAEPNGIIQRDDVLINGKWVRYFSVENLGWRFIRLERDKFLRMSDWSQTVDIPMSPAKLTEWRNYRQTLRDIPTAFTTPEEVVFPSIPE